VDGGIGASALALMENSIGPYKTELIHRCDTG